MSLLYERTQFDVELIDALSKLCLLDFRGLRFQHLLNFFLSNYAFLRFFKGFLSTLKLFIDVLHPLAFEHIKIMVDV